MPPRRLVRREAFAQRLQAYLDPWNVVLWIFEELDSGDWEQWLQKWSIPVGISFNLIILIARANGGNAVRGMDDVFGDDDMSSNWVSWLFALIVWIFTLLSFINAAWAFLRKRQYRLFEAPVDARPNTSSARRVHIDSLPPASSSPLRLLSNMINPETPESRAYADVTRDVWELSVWDPKPSALRIFCYFSPGHILIYWLFLPTSTHDPRPSITVATTITLAALLSFQLSVLQSSFSQLAKDVSVIQKEVLNEYNVKYVHPRTQPLVRDVGTQFSRKESSDAVDVYAPVTIINKGFHTNPNPNYLGHIGPQAVSSRFSPTPSKFNGAIPTIQTPTYLQDFSSPVQPRTALHQPQLRPTYQGSGDGGSLGVHTHAQSPLRRSASTNFAGGCRERERTISPAKREGRPLKRSNLAENSNRLGAGAEHVVRFSQSSRQQGGRESDRS